PNNQYTHVRPSYVEVPNDADHFQNYLYRIMYQQGFIFQSFEDQFSVGVPDAEVAEKLGVPQEPLLQRVRFSYDEQGDVLEYSVAFYNTDMHKYVVTLDA